MIELNDNFIQDDGICKFGRIDSAFKTPNCQEEQLITFRMTGSDEFRTFLLGCDDHEDPCPLAALNMKIGLPDQHHDIPNTVAQRENLADQNIPGTKTINISSNSGVINIATNSSSSNNGTITHNKPL